LQNPAINGATAFAHRTLTFVPSIGTLMIWISAASLDAGHPL